MSDKKFTPKQVAFEVLASVRKILEKSDLVKKESVESEYVHGLPKGHPALHEYKEHSIRRGRPPVAGENNWEWHVKSPKGHTFKVKLPAHTGGSLESIHSHLDAMNSGMQKSELESDLEGLTSLLKSNGGVFGMSATQYAKKTGEEHGTGEKHNPGISSAGEDVRSSNKKWVDSDQRINCYLV